MSIGKPAQLFVSMIAFASADFAYGEEGIPGFVGAIAVTPYFQTMWFRVAAVNAAGQSGWSDPATKIVP